MYTVIDIETTGGSPKSDRITEIAIFVFDGEKIIDQFVSLVNPEKTLEPFITRLTGITNEMLVGAPKFYEIAKQIVEITDNRIFVAHNANFDYNFIKTEFANLGFDFKRQTVDTVRLARILIPGRRSYSLGNICADLGIPINGRHRAAGDAEATTKLFEILLNLDGKKKPLISEMAALKFDGMNPDFNLDIIKNLPEKT
ncbi:MAG TPA: exonuclease, partial [Bacteroidales bacterium]|nr:exonuclease [Bacteroidales bacterium]